MVMIISLLTVWFIMW